MNNHKYSETAFPWKHSTGMTLRDYFAAKAMQGIAKGIEDEVRAARWCYEMADAMLEARKNERE